MKKKQFEFVLDQTKILDLLVGHTLYNDSSVVLRELTQNAIDASKLKKYELDSDGVNDYVPQIEVNWSSKSRELSFIDNGTGMTLEIIQNHLLKVGSSRYQDEKFRKSYPDFSSISRFGIGLLTCFLIADDIDITTKSSDSDKAILLRIKKVHGKYLLKYLPANQLKNEIQIHGTSIKLYVRPEIKLGTIKDELDKWILFPNCKMTLNNDGVVSDIGYDDPQNLLSQGLKNLGITVDDVNYKIKQFTEDGITYAFALKYNKHWKEWSFLELKEIKRGETVPIGTCIEGIRVDFGTPGFKGKNFYVVVNATGKNAPKTNVARSNVESTSERRNLLQKIYKSYLEHISTEIQNLRKNGFSITWAAREGNWLLRNFTNSRLSSPRSNEFEDIELFKEELSEMRCILIENNNSRSLKSVNDLKELKHYWTIDCASYSSADSLLREVKSSNSTALSLLNNIFGDSSSNNDHIDNLLCDSLHDIFISEMINSNFQVTNIKLIPDQRRLDLKWSLIDSKLWEVIEVNDDEWSGRRNSKCFIQLIDIQVDGISNQSAINSSDALFILKNSELNKYLIKIVNEFKEKSQEERYVLSLLVGLMNSFFYIGEITEVMVNETLERKISNNNRRLGGDDRVFWSRINRDELVSVILKTDFIKYDTTIWSRGRDLM